MIHLPEGYSIREGADAVAAQQFLTDSYWSKGITLEEVVQSFANSWLVSIWHQDNQVGMARVVSDQVTIAYVNDVYVLEQHRGRGLASLLLKRVLGEARFAGVKRWLLFTKDAQGLYAGSGFRQYPWPKRVMIIDPKVFPA